MDKTTENIQQLGIDTVRILAADAVQKQTQVIRVRQWGWPL